MSQLTLIEIIIKTLGLEGGWKRHYNPGFYLLLCRRKDWEDVQKNNGVTVDNTLDILFIQHKIKRNMEASMGEELSIPKNKIGNTSLLEDSGESTREDLVVYYFGKLLQLPYRGQISGNKLRDSF